MGLHAAELPDQYIVAFLSPTTADALAMFDWLEEHGYRPIILPTTGDTKPVDVVRHFNHDTD